MRSTKILLLTAMAAMALAWQAKADLVLLDLDPGSATYGLDVGPGTVLQNLKGTAPDNKIIAGFPVLPDSSLKSIGVIDFEGSLSVTTPAGTFSASGTGTSTTLTWDIVNGFKLLYVIVKTGNNTGGPTTYLYEVALDQQGGGSATIPLNGLPDENYGSLSSVTFVGNGHAIPDGGTTAILLGLGLSALGLARRGRKA